MWLLPDSYQAFNESKFMNVIDSYRDIAGAIDLINAAVDQYRTLISMERT